MNFVRVVVTAGLVILASQFHCYHTKIIENVTYQIRRQYLYCIFEESLVNFVRVAVTAGLGILASQFHGYHTKIIANVSYEIRWQCIFGRVVGELCRGSGHCRIRHIRSRGPSPFEGSSAGMPLFAALHQMEGRMHMSTSVCMLTIRDIAVLSAHVQ